MVEAVALTGARCKSRCRHAPKWLRMRAWFARCVCVCVCVPAHVRASLPSSLILRYPSKVGCARPAELNARRATKSSSSAESRAGLRALLRALAALLRHTLPHSLGLLRLAARERAARAPRPGAEGPRRGGLRGFDPRRAAERPAAEHGPGDDGATPSGGVAAALRGAGPSIAPGAPRRSSARREKQHRCGEASAHDESRARLQPAGCGPQPRQRRGPCRRRFQLLHMRAASSATRSGA